MDLVKLLQIISNSLYGLIVLVGFCLAILCFILYIVAIDFKRRDNEKKINEYIGQNKDSTND